MATELNVKRFDQYLEKRYIKPYILNRLFKRIMPIYQAFIKYNKLFEAYFFADLRGYCTPYQN